MAPHPLCILSVDEINLARDVILSLHSGTVVDFREIFLREPDKAVLAPFLDTENAVSVAATAARPPRLAKCQYDVIGGDRTPEYHESVVDLNSRERVQHEVVGKQFQAYLTVREFDVLVKACSTSILFQDAIAELDLPEGFEVVIEPWPYGGPDQADGDRRYFQGLIFAQDKRNGNPDSNFYAYPLPLIPILDIHKREIVRIDRLATGGKEDGIQHSKTQKKGVIDHCRPAEYVPELLPAGQRSDLKPLHVVQPEGASFRVIDESRVEWQKWSFRVSFNPREGAVLHDVRYDGRSVLYRLSISEMTVPYADARSPFQRKQAFDFGDGGIGEAANSLELGCDCLGLIKYFDGVVVDGDGSARVRPKLICLHEQDNGLAWKHTNWRTGRATAARSRELVVQFIITLANYEYIFAYKFDQSGGITVETRATGIVSVVNIDEGKTSNYGNVVNPGVLAQNHQHVFCVRIDPAVDGHNNSVIMEESLPVAMNPESNPHGNYYEVRQTPLISSTWQDAAPQNNRIFKMINSSRKNAISGKPVGYKLIPPATQLLLADPSSIQAQRAQFAQHHVWLTAFRDQELYAGGRFTLQSRKEVGGVADAVARKDELENGDVVVWSVFGLTHNPRVEDWPVMPAEKIELCLRPVDFFEKNPSLDVPVAKDGQSKLATKECCNSVSSHKL